MDHVKGVASQAWTSRQHVTPRFGMNELLDWQGYWEVTGKKDAEFPNHPLPLCWGACLCTGQLYALATKQHVLVCACEC